MPTVQAKDLTKEFPRSPFETLAGFPWLPRLIDKVRSLDAGKIGEYTPFPCGGDQNFLRTIGIEPDALKAVISGGASDEEIGRWVKEHARPDAETHLQGYRQQQFAPVEGEMANYLAHAKEELGKARPDLDVSGVKNWAQLICLEEGHTIPNA
jgi:hypothetical protein